jgi:triacylglycerol esterase/lipase EstA (alpha/beta hydrolase family)
MTLNSLQSWRKALPFLIAIACIVPVLIHSGGLEAIPLRYTLIAVALALIVPFFYVVLKLREPSWNRELEAHVRSQIRNSLITLIPNDLNVTAEEREQLKNTEIYKDLSGVFWDTVSKDELLRAQKEHFYSNGLEYTTVIDVFLLLRFFGICYAGISLLLGDATLFVWGAVLVGVALAAKWLAIPRARKEHLKLSAEQLELLKREKGDYVSERFRNIVLEWRKAQSTGSAAPLPPSRRGHPALWDAIVVAIILLIAATGVYTRGWFGMGAGVKSSPQLGSRYIDDGTHTKPVVVVFVHGVFGDKEETWLNTESKASFPELLAADPTLVKNVDVFVFEYFTPKFSLAPSIVDLADQLRGELIDHQVFSQHKTVVFLAHSMGGIIVRQYLLSNQDNIPNVPMIYFYATPTNGSDLAALAKIATANPQLRGMTPIEGNDFLQSIQSQWLNSNKAKAIGSYCGLEELQTDGQIVVTRSSATSLCNRALDPFTANHIEIVKPKNRTDPRYTRFRSALLSEVPDISAQ